MCDDDVIIRWTRLRPLICHLILWFIDSVFGFLFHSVLSVIVALCLSNCVMLLSILIHAHQY